MKHLTLNHCNGKTIKEISAFEKSEGVYKSILVLFEDGHQLRVEPYSKGGLFVLPIVPDDLLPLAFGTKACSAGDVPKVPKAWELGPSAR